MSTAISYSNEAIKPWYQFPVTEIRDDRGEIVIYPDGACVPKVFDMNRVYFLFTRAAGAVRGNHAHKRLWQVCVALSGQVSVDLDDGDFSETVRLGDPSSALMIGPMVWRRLHGFSENSICAVLASEPYDPDDYIHERDRFLLLASRKKLM